jgi:hypothetical protein
VRTHEHPPRALVALYVAPSSKRMDQLRRAPNRTPASRRDWRHARPVTHLVDTGQPSLASGATTVGRRSTLIALGALGRSSVKDDRDEHQHHHELYAKHIVRPS